jgi:hypothetical protein
MTTTSAALVPIQPAFTDAERLALAGFLAGYRGLTREAYALDLRQVTTWCRTKVVTIPLAPRTARAIDLAIGERTDGRAGVPGPGRAAAGPARRRADRPQDRPPRRDHQGRHAPHAQARIHHRGPRRRGPAAGCAGSCLACGPADHDAV